MTYLARTPLHEEHRRLGAKMVPFAGFDMPVQYPTGVLKEYHTVRRGGAGLFDISHMGQVRITGRQSLDFLQYVGSNDASALTDGQVQYSALLSEHGTFIDDITTYRLGEGIYYLCVNAVNRRKDVAHLKAYARNFDVCVRDESEETALLALQGGSSQKLLQGHVDAKLADIPYYRFTMASICGIHALISRTGYTGEDGFEIYLASKHAAEVWNRLLANGATPIGLACRDMLRIEMGYALYGHEIDEHVTPVEANLMWITKTSKPEFIGKDAVIERQAKGPEKRLVGLKLKERGIPREHYPVMDHGTIVGEVTSGMFSPLLGKGIALAYVSPSHAMTDQFSILVRNRPLAAERVKPPFIRSKLRK